MNSFSIPSALTTAEGQITEKNMKGVLKKIRKAKQKFKIIFKMQIKIMTSDFLPIRVTKLLKI